MRFTILNEGNYGKQVNRTNFLKVGVIPSADKKSSNKREISMYGILHKKT